LFRKAYKEDKTGSIGFTAGMFVLGLLAGWCNENSSGGVIFIVLLLMLLKWLPKKDFSGIRSWMVSGLAGNVIGFLILLLSPGNRSRAASAEEAHSGLLGFAARALRVTLTLKENYLILILVFMVIAIAIAYRTGSKDKFLSAASRMLIFGVAFFVTSYALVAVPDSQLRTYYCASLFLMTGIASGFAWIVNEGFSEDLIQIVATSFITVFSVLLFFSFIENGANLARIKREFDERDAYLTEAAKGEEMVVEAPMLRPEWDNRYSMAYESDICEDKFNWLNLSYAEHYGLWYIIGVDRESWTGY
jgi:cbb3-type cytochrome oxidase subunit 3